MNGHFMILCHTAPVKKFVNNFLSFCCFQLSYESERGKEPMNVLKAVGSVKNSVKNVTNAVTSVPNNLINTVDSVMDGITKALQVKTCFCWLLSIKPVNINPTF